MRVVELEQGSEDWLAWRSCGIGGSDAPVIMGVSPWQNRAGLLKHKLTHRYIRERTTDKNKSEAMLRGTRLEPEAREAYITLTGNQMTPACVLHDQFDWLKVSLDGLSPDRTLALEVKCVNKEHHKTALSGLVPKVYWPQLCHELLVTGLPMVHYWSYSKSTLFTDLQKTALVKVRRDEDYLQYLLEEETRFWEEFLEKSKK